MNYRVHVDNSIDYGITLTAEPVDGRKVFGRFREARSLLVGLLQQRRDDWALALADARTISKDDVLRGAR